MLLLQILKGGAGAEEKDNLKQISNEVRECCCLLIDAVYFTAKVTYKILVLYKELRL